MKGLMKAIEGLVSRPVLAVAGAAGVAYLVWPRAGTPISAMIKNKTGLSTQAASAITNGIGAAGALFAKRYLPAEWQIAGTAFAGVLVYGVADNLLPQFAGALPAA